MARRRLPGTRPSLLLAVLCLALLGGCGAVAQHPSNTGAPAPDNTFNTALGQLLSAAPGSRTALAARVLNLAASRGTPVIEGDTLTFLWQGKARQVQVIGSFVPALEMRAVDGTDLWVARKQIPDLGHATLSYLLQVDDQLVRDPLSHWDPEETQPKQLTWRGNQVVVPPEIRPKSDVPHGTVQELNLESASLGDTRKVTVYLPPGYSSRQRYPVIYATDAQIFIGRMQLPAMLDNLIAEKRLPPLVAVCIDSNYEQRQAEYLPDGDRWDDYGSFFLDELLPQIERQFSVAGDREGRVLMGLSNGAAWSAYTAAEHPDRFRGAISLSAGLTRPEAMPAAKPGLHQQFYVVRGSLEEGFADAQQYLVKSLTDMGAQVKAVERPAGHEPVYWSEELVPALQWIFPDH